MSDRVIDDEVLIKLFGDEVKRYIDSANRIDVIISWGVDGESFDIDFRPLFNFNRYSKKQIMIVLTGPFDFRYEWVDTGEFKKYKLVKFYPIKEEGIDYWYSISIIKNTDPDELCDRYNKYFDNTVLIGLDKVPELGVKSEEEKIVERMIGETHLINEDTYVEVNYEGEVREWIEKKNSVGGWRERWKKYYCVNGSWMVMNGGTVRHLMSEVYGLSREEVYLSLWLISQDEEYYVKNWAEVLTPNKLPGYVFYPDGFYGRLGAMRQYLITRGWVDLEIDVIYEIVKLNADYYENKENRLNTEKREIYNGC